MHILKVGFTYKTAPIEIREKLVFSQDTIEDAMRALNKQKSVLENVIISTCNRTEIYVVVDQIHTGRYYVKQFLADWFNLDKEEFSPYLQILENEGAVEHLFRVTVGLNSMVIGETQILGQVRDAFLTAQKIKVTGTIFNELFKRAVTFAKRAHRETGISSQAVSISYAAVELAKKIFGKIDDKRIVINGAGEMAELALENLYGSGVTDITVVNRTLANAEKIAARFKAEAKESSELLNVLKTADILISSTASPTAVLTKEDIELIQKDRQDKPLFLVDIALPRDLDPNINQLENVFLYDIDDLQHVVDDNLQMRKEAAELIEIQIEGEIIDFNEWVRTLGVVPIISALREKALKIQSETFDSILRKIPDLDEREKKVISKHTKSIVNQLLKEPIKQVKELAGTEDPNEALSLFVEIFGIKDEVDAQVKKRLEKTRGIQTTQHDKVSFALIERVLSK